MGRKGKAPRPDAKSRRIGSYVVQNYENKCKRPCFFLFFSVRPADRPKKNDKNPLREATLHKKQKKNRKKTRLHQPQTVNLQPIQTVGKRRDTGQTRPHLTAPEKDRQKTGNTYTRKSART